MPFDNVPSHVPTKVPAKENQQISDDVRKLKEARDLISQGWCQNSIRNPVFEPHHLYGYFEKPRYDYCMMGALMHACSPMTPGANMQTCRIVESYIFPEIAGWNFCMYKSEPIRTVERYNDYPGRQKEEVIEVFNRAIARAMRAQ